MNNDELKKKIVEVLNSTEISKELSKDDIYKFADALISAGIGDVKEAECKVKGMVKQNQLLSMALWIVCYEKAGIGMPFKCKHDKCETEMGAPCCRETATDCFIKEAIKQAEKELSKGGKDE